MVAGAYPLREQGVKRPSTNLTECHESGGKCRDRRRLRATHSGALPEKVLPLARKIPAQGHGHGSRKRTADPEIASEPAYELRIEKFVEDDTAPGHLVVVSSDRWL